MAFEEYNNMYQDELADFYCVVKDKEHDFYWVINLEDHPGTFLLDKSYQQFIPSSQKEDQESFILIQPQER